MSTSDTAEQNPLGWPPGSVRGMLSLLIAIQFWLLLLLPDSLADKAPIPINLYLMLTLVGMFLVSHRKSADSAALFFPAGVLRILIIAGTAATIGYLYTHDYDRLVERLQPKASQLQYWPPIVGAYVAGFLLGYILRHMPFRNNWLFQALLAWMSMIAMFLLFLEIILRVFVNVKLEEELQVNLLNLGMTITAIVSCYFGTRA